MKWVAVSCLASGLGVPGGVHVPPALRVGEYWWVGGRLVGFGVWPSFLLTVGEEPARKSAALANVRAASVACARLPYGGFVPAHPDGFAAFVRSWFDGTWRP